MRDGLDEDDIYIMVEDEFQATAKLFTQHLHHAEYVRLKNLAKAQNISTIKSISRPTDKVTKQPTETSRQLEGAERAKKQKRALKDMLKTGSDKDANDDSEEEYDPWVGTSLHGLMTTPKKSRKSLSDLADIRSN